MDDERWALPFAALGLPAELEKVVFCLLAETSTSIGASRE